MAEAKLPPLNRESKNALSRHPEINYVEPAGIAGAQAAVAEIAADKFENLVAEREQVRKLYDAIDKLAAATQAKIDNRAKDIKILLDDNVDALTKQAMERKYPEDDSGAITYGQYRKCKDNLSNFGEGVADRMLIDESMMEASQRTPLHQIGGTGTGAEKDGRLRPDLNDNAYIIKPLKIKDYKKEVVKEVVNLVWKYGIRAQFKSVVPPPLFNLIPEELFPDTNMGLSMPSSVLDSANADERLSTEDALSKLRPEAAKREVTNPLAFQDCMLITNTFEKGLAFSNTEEAVLASMTSVLQTMRSQSKATKKRLSAVDLFRSKKKTKKKIKDTVLEAVGVKRNIGDQGPENIDPEGKENIFTRIAENFVPTEIDPKTNEKKFHPERILDSECFPCGTRIRFLEQGRERILFKDSAFVKALSYWGKVFINQLLGVQSLFDSVQPVDFCQFINYLLDFVCIPDLARMLALLTMHLQSLSIDIFGGVDMVMALIAPLIMPILTGLLGTLRQFMVSIIDPIRCFIDSLVVIINKLDYNVLFNRAEDLRVDVSVGGRFSANTGSTGVSTNKGFQRDYSFNYGKPLADEQQKRNDNYLEAERKLREAEKGLNKGRTTEGADLKMLSDREKVARDNLEQARIDRDYSFVGKASLQVQKLRPMFEQLVTFLYAQINKVEAKISEIYSEFQALTSQFTGGSAQLMARNTEKLQAMRLRNLIAGLIQLLKEKKGRCSPDEAIRSTLDTMSTENFLFYRREDGTIQVQQNLLATEVEIDLVLQALGGENADSLIESTGNPIIDKTIAETVDALTSPSAYKLECNSVTTLKQSEQINNWIAELNQV